MSMVIHRVSKECRCSVNTPDYDPIDWIINPNLSAVEGVDKRYWKVVGDTIIEMTAQEKIDADAAYLGAVKQAKFIEIDAVTATLIGEGFLYAGKTFSLSIYAQKHWTELMISRDAMSYPIRINTKDDTGAHSIASGGDVVVMYNALVLTVRAHLASGTELKDQVRAAETIEQVTAIVDDRV